MDRELVWVSVRPNGGRGAAGTAVCVEAEDVEDAGEVGRAEEDDLGLVAGCGGFNACAWSVRTEVYIC